MANILIFLLLNSISAVKREDLINRIFNIRERKSWPINESPKLSLK